MLETRKMNNNETRKVDLRNPPSCLVIITRHGRWIYESISLFCTVFEILTLICQKVKTSRDFDRTHLGGSLSLQHQYFSGQTMQKIWRFYVHHQLQRNFRACKILKWITWPGPRPFQGQSAVRRLKFDIPCKGTKFDHCSLSRSRDTSRAMKL